MNQGTMMIKYYYSTLSIVTAVKTTLKDTTKETFSIKALTFKLHSLNQKNQFSAKKYLGSFDEAESTATIFFATCILSSSFFCKLTNTTVCSRADHFKINFIENCCKFEIFLVKIGTYGLPKPFVGPTSLQVPAVLPTQPTYRHGYRLRGQKCRNLQG